VATFSDNLEQSHPEAVTYSGSTIAVVSGLSLAQWGVVVGIATALLGLTVQIYLGFRRERRERELHKLRLAALKRDK